MSAELIESLIGCTLSEATARIRAHSAELEIVHDTLINDLQKNADTALVVRAREHEGTVYLILTPFIMKV